MRTISITDDQFAAFSRGEPIQIIPPKPRVQHNATIVLEGKNRQEWHAYDAMGVDPEDAAEKWYAKLCTTQRRDDRYEGALIITAPRRVTPGDAPQYTIETTRAKYFRVRNGVVVPGL